MTGTDGGNSSEISGCTSGCRTGVTVGMAEEGGLSILGVVPGVSKSELESKLVGGGGLPVVAPPRVLTPAMHDSSQVS